MSKIKTLLDLQKYTDAFINYDTVESMKVRKIPVEYHEVLPNHCECGAEMIISNDLTEIQCCDPYCRIKMSFNLAYFISYLGYKGIGSAICKRLFDIIYTDDMYPSFLVAFDVDEKTLVSVLGVHNADVFMNIRKSIQETPITFKDSIASLGIPNIGAKSKIFDFLAAPADIVSLILNNTYNKFLDDIGLTAPSYKYGFDVFAPSIAYLYSKVVLNIIAESNVEVYIAVTGEVSVGGHYYTRKEFLQLCSSYVDDDGIPFYKFKETLDAKKLDWVVADRPSNTAKYLKGKNLGCLITADDFIEKVKSRTLK